MPALSILHVSDVHFGVGDAIAEQPRITEALAEAVREVGIVPTYCIFNGDLANSGLRDEFMQGERWLARLIPAGWDTKLLIVPGNHDVHRDGTRPHLFRALVGEQKIYTDWTRAKTVNCDHLATFLAWHNEASGRIALAGDWNTPFGFLFQDDSYPIPINIIGLNSALFSCADDDKGNLVVDVKTLNTYLDAASQIGGLVLVAAHHPLEYLAPWNAEQVQRLLAQEKGAHVFLHGHLHDPSSRSRSDNLGSGLTTLAAGASYQDSKWPQGFALYTFDFSKREIATSAYNYAPSSGRWFKDDSKSRPIVAKIPLHHAPWIRRVAVAAEESAGDSETPPPAKHPVNQQAAHAPPEAPAARPSSGNGVKRPKELGQIKPKPPVDPHIDNSIPGIARELRDAAREAQGVLLQYFSANKDLRGFSIKSRVKEVSRIVDKFKERRTGDLAYDVKAMPDICGFRIITRYQDEIPRVIEALLSQTENRALSKIPFLADLPIEIEIHNSRTAVDPLSLEQPVRAICAQSNLRPATSVSMRDTLYSSIHFVGWVDTPTSEYSSISRIRAEVQVRSALEDVWGEIDHELQLQMRRKDPTLPKNRHLVVLKGLIDAIISYVDIIKKQVDDGRERPAIEKVVARSVNEPNSQLKKMKSLNLPEAMYDRLEKAFQAWEQARGSGEDPGRPELFEAGAKAFSDLLTEFRDEPSDNPKLAAEFAYICELEYAYMYQFTENPDALARAESVYINILNQRRDDIVANFRLGALYRKLSRFDESREYLRTARDGLLGSQDPEINTSHFIYDHVRREIGLTEWRIAEDQTRPVEVRRDSLVVALRSAHDVIHKPAVSDRYSRLSAINDFLYYYKFEASRVPGVRESFAVPPAEVDAYVDELYRYYRGLDPAKLSYNWVDTLLRCYPDDKEKALELIDQLEILLERLVTDRKPRLLDNVPARGTHRWFGTLASELDPDERDSLIFAQETKEKWTRK